MRTVAMLIGIAGGVLTYFLGGLIFGMSFGKIQAEIPSFWNFVLASSLLGVAGGIVSRWRSTIGAILMGGSAFVWLLFSWHFLRAINLPDSTRGIVSTVVVILFPVLLMGLASFMALKRKATKTLPPQ